MAVAPPAELEVLVRMSQSVHTAVRHARTSPHRADVVAMGADGSPTEQMDRVAESVVLATLKSEGLDWNVVSEEIGRVDRGGEWTLVVDPIDGSHNALRGIPFATVSLALGRTDLESVELGLVHDLFNGTTFWAARGLGAFCDGRPIHVRGWDRRQEMFFVNLGRHSTPRAVAFAGRGRRIRSLGCASLEMAMVALGAADAYIFENETPHRNLRVTDIAAAYRIVREAGGFVGDAAFQPLETFPLALGHHTSVAAWGDPQFSQAGGPEGWQ
ncbi:MAG: inositol monophosphatase [Thermoplasmata archaeon]|nr:inositol monophosphatase [Thermoplasmata archaeon]